MNDACWAAWLWPADLEAAIGSAGGKMNRWTMRKNCAGVYSEGGLSWGLLALLACCTMTAPAQTTSQSKNPPFSIPATHLLGFENAKGNGTGTLTIQDQLLQFQQGGNPEAQVAIASIRDVFLGGESKQVGGLPMTLGKTAAPFGGGRVVSLFAHKNYDILTLEYTDNDGGVHGAIFQLTKGQGEVVRNELVARGASLSSGQNQS